VLGQLGIAAPASFEGSDLSPWLEGTPPEPLFAISALDLLNEDRVSIRGQRWKLVGRALYDLDADPQETLDQRGRWPKVAAQLEDRLAAAITAGRDGGPASPSHETRSQLLSLGYASGGDDAGAPTIPPAMGLPMPRMPLVAVIGDIVTLPAVHPLLATKIGTSNYALGTIASAGRKGCLQYGPYVELGPGGFDVSWFGTVDGGGTRATVDAVRSQGQVVIERREIELRSRGEEGLLANLPFAIAERHGDVEFRLFVEGGANVTLSMVRLRLLTAEEYARRAEQARGPSPSRPASPHAPGPRKAAAGGAVP
jgi:hypothetical protein